MKHILTISILAATVFLAQADDRTIPQKVRNAADNVADTTKEAAKDTKDAIVDAAHEVRRAARSGWQKTKAFFSDDPPVYNEGARATLVALGREIAELKARTPLSAPKYFQTRLLALDEQQAFLSSRVALMTREELRNRTAGPRHEFDRFIADLEQAIDQAQNGADTLARMALR